MAVIQRGEAASTGFEDQPVILTVPGLGGSGPGHWQSRWEGRFPWVRRADLGLWNEPDPRIWVERLDRAVHAAARPVILVAHSLGCIAVATWAGLIGQGYGRPVAGALLVAPADPDRSGAAAGVRRFAPVPRVPLPFPSILVASRNDPHTAFTRAGTMARDWCSHLVDAGNAGHINADSGIGDWPLGLGLVDRLVDAAGVARDLQRGLARSARFLSAGLGEGPASAAPRPT